LIGNRHKILKTRTNIATITLVISQPKQVKAKHWRSQKFRLDGPKMKKLCDVFLVTSIGWRNGWRWRHNFWRLAIFENLLLK